MVDQVPEDVAIENREVVRVPDVPQEMGRLLHREPVDLPHQPVARRLVGRERGQRLLQDPVPAAPKSVTCCDEVCGLVVVESDVMPEQRRNRLRVPLEEELRLHQSLDCRGGCASLRLDREDAVGDLLEEPRIGQLPHRPELREPRPDCIPVDAVLATKFVQMAVPGRASLCPLSSSTLRLHRSRPLGGNPTA